MGAIESTEAGNIWESAEEEFSRGINYREDETYREDRYEEEPAVRGEEPVVAASSPSPARPVAAPSPAAAAVTAAANESEITTEAEAPEQSVDLSTSKSQKPNRIAPAEVKVRITMAVPQGVVSTHYVCYAENSAGLEFLTSPVEERLKELLVERENAVANEV